MKRLIQSKYKLYRELFEKVDEPYKNIISELAKPEAKELSKSIQDYQSLNKIPRLDINYLKKEIPECIYSGPAYRGIILSIKDLDINNLEFSIKKKIYKNKIESWSKSKSFVDGFNKMLNVNMRKIKDPVVVRLKANIEGLDISKFLNYLSEKYNTKNYNLFENEEEVLTSTPNNYEIYNLDEIKSKLEYIPKVVKKFGFW